MSGAESWLLSAFDGQGQGGGLYQVRERCVLAVESHCCGHQLSRFDSAGARIDLETWSGFRRQLEWQG